MGLIFKDSIIDSHIPFKGSCAFCGHQDARHRIFDAIMERPECTKTISYDYELPVMIVNRIKRLKPYGD